MSYAYRARKKAIKRAKKVHEDELEHGQLLPEHMPVNPHPPKFLGTLEDLL